MEAIFGVLPVAVVLILIWLTYLNLSYAVTIYRVRKKDATLKFCLSKFGVSFYICLILIYCVLLVVSTVVMILLLMDKENTIIFAILNTITIFSMGVTFLLQQIILVGHRQMLIGKIILDYRKIKRVSYPKTSKLEFVYGQKSYQTTLWFIDDFKLKKSLQKAR